jgi:hypothetical protein
MHVTEDKIKKLDDKGGKCNCVGYNEQSKRYKLYSPLTKENTINRHVVFDEEVEWNWNGKYEKL